MTDLQRVLRAAGDGDLETLGRLLEADGSLVNGIDANPYWGGRVQPLHLAVTWGREAAVEMLLEAGADPSGENEGYGGWSPLMLAASRGSEAIAWKLETSGAYVGLFEASALGRHRIVREVLEGNPERASHVTGDGTTPLHLAADVTVADLLLDAGALPEATDAYGGTPLDAAVARAARGVDQAQAVARRLIEAGAAADATTWAALGDLPALERAIARDPAARDRRGRRGRAPLHAAAAHGRLDAVRWLLARGAPPDEPDADGIGPLHAVACAPRHEVEMARALLEAGADLRARDGQHDATPAGWAQFQGREELRAFLLGAQEAETRLEPGGDTAV